MDSPGRSTRSGRRRASTVLLGQLLTSAVDTAADAVALRHSPTGGLDDLTSCTYRELDEVSSQLARQLIARGVGAGDVVAVGLPRSWESVLAVWSIAKTGAAYVPVDPAYPAQRIAHMMADSGAVLGLTTSAHRAALGQGVLWLVLDHPAVRRRMAEQPRRPVSYADRVRPVLPQHPAYVIYTSGSTGLPKAVVVTHAGLSGLVASERELLTVTADSRVLHVCSPSFDVSVLELLVAFTTGATLVVSPPTVFGGDELVQLLRRERVTHLLITPGALASVDPSDLPDLRVVLVAGDRFGRDLVARWASAQRSFHNGYGPTEATILATTSAPLRGDQPPTMGAALAGVAAFVLDSRLRPVPSGVAGELYLGGVGLAREYLHQPGKTAERFVASPFTGQHSQGTRLYRTGDLVREVAGTLEYLGRCDFQVKIRGHRIEPGELDAALVAHPDVEFAVSMGRELGNGEVALVSYVVARPGTLVDPARLTDFVAASLPRYLVPAAIVVLDEIPLTAVGKVDRTRLPAPTFAARQFRAPATPIQQIVAEVYAALLVPDNSAPPAPEAATGDTPAPARVGLDDDFFALGGNSLLAAQAAARIGAALGLRVPVQLLFESTTVAALADRMERHTSADIGIPLRPMPRPEHIPLSYAQQRMWFLNRFAPESAVDNIALAVRLRGRLDLPALQEAVRDLVLRHEVLRTVYPDLDGAGYQRVLPITDSRAVPQLAVITATEAQLSALMSETITGSFDVTQAPPVRVRVVRMAETEHVLVCVVHHIAGDGFSMAPLTRDLMTAYVTRVRGSAPRWEPLPVQYADYALWQRETLGAEDDPTSPLARQIAYWRQRLAGMPDQSTLPTARPRPAIASHRGAAVAFAIDSEVHAELMRLARDHQATVFMVVHAALAVLLARLSGSRDIVVGTPVAGRGDAAADQLIGMFVNTLVLRTAVAPDTTFGALLDAVRSNDIEAFGHAEVPFERLVELLDPPRSPARHPLFQVMLTFQNLAVPRLQLPGLAISDMGAALPLAKFDLQFTLAEKFDDNGVPQGISAELGYATELFDTATITACSQRFNQLLAAAITGIDCAVGDLDLLLPGERAQLLHSWVDTAVPLADTAAVSLPDAVVARAQRRPDAVAVRHDHVALTFAHLQRRASRVARALIAAGVGPESLVAVAVARTEQLPVALLGVLLSGAAYLPIDTAYPRQRQQYILADAAPQLVLATADTRADLAAGALPVLLLEDTDSYPDTLVTDAERRAPLRPDNLAYVIYTSGSTGRPKGVGVTHRGVQQLFANAQRLFDFDETDVWALFHSYAFDFSVWELWCALVTGATVVVIDHLTARSPEQLRELLIRDQVTVLNQTPSAFGQLAEVDWDEADWVEGAPLPATPQFALRYVVFGGEALQPWQVRRWYQRHPANAPQLVNMYGITETTVHVTYAALTPRLAEHPGSLLGRALPGMAVSVVDDRLHLMPVGCAGELSVAGGQLARGYLGLPGLTATRFVANAWGPPGSRQYRSGDVGRWVSVAGDTVLEYMGRSDSQVQLRGFRIELGEVEAALLRCPGVGMAVAVVRADEHTGDRLVGYVVADATAVLDSAALRAQVAALLPSYMIPDAVVVLDSAPVTPHGKLDRNALPAPDFVGTAAFRAPQTPIQQAVADVFATVLGARRVGLDDDFFTLGGNSLLATRAVARLEDALDTAVAVRELFESSTVAGLSARLVNGVGAATGRPRLAPVPRPPGERLPLSFAQQRMWVLNQLDPQSSAYNIPMAIRLTGALDVDALRQAVTDVVQRHEVLRTRYPADPATGLPYQEILPAPTLLPPGPLVPTSDPMGDVAHLLSGGFDLATEIPVRAALIATDSAATNIETSEQSVYVLAVVVHHIVADAASQAPLARDLITAYLARHRGREPGWAPLPVQYADFAVWQREVMGDESDDSSVFAQQRAYWCDQLAGLSAGVLVPDRPRPAGVPVRAAVVHGGVAAPVHQQLVRLAHHHNASLFMVVHAALAALLARLSGASDIALVTAIAGRREPALDELVGMFVNTLVLRTTVSATDTFDAVVETARETDLGAFAHADIPFERVVELLADHGSRARAGEMPFQVALAFQNAEPPLLRLPGLTIETLETEALAAKFDLQVIVEPRHDNDRAAEPRHDNDRAVEPHRDEYGAPAALGIMVSYAVELFDESRMQQLCRCFEQVLRAVVEDPQRQVGSIDITGIVDTPGSDMAVTEVGAEAAGQPAAPRVRSAGRRTSLPQALTVNVEEDPEAAAVVFDTEEIGYQDLDARSSRLARVLLEHGCGPGDAVALQADRELAAVVAIWAIVKTGAALVPADAVPASRAAGLTPRLGLVAATALENARKPPDTADITWLNLADAQVIAQVAAHSAHPVTYADRPRALTGADPAYVAETTLSYDELAAMVDRLCQCTKLTFDSRTLATATPNLLGFVLEVVAAGSVAAALVLTDSHITVEVLAQEWVTHLFTDSAGGQLVATAPPTELQAIVVTTAGPTPRGTVTVMGLDELLTGKVATP